MKQDGLLKKAGKESVEQDASNLPKDGKKAQQTPGPTQLAMRVPADQNEIPDPPPNKD